MFASLLTESCFYFSLISQEETVLFSFHVIYLHLLIFLLEGKIFSQVVPTANFKVNKQSNVLIFLKSFLHYLLLFLSLTLISGLFA